MQSSDTTKGVLITTAEHGGVQIQVDGLPGRFAILSQQGQIVEQGQAVADRVAAAAIARYEATLSRGLRQRRSDAPEPVVPRP